MRLGIDFGTTRTVVAVADRGNYPVVGFQLENGDIQHWYPSLIAADGMRWLFGLDALAIHEEPGWTVLRSFKRLLSKTGPESSIPIAGQSLPAVELLTDFLTRLRSDLIERSDLQIVPGDSLDAWVAVPANANSNQRFLTLECYRRAGFKVIGMMNEPSAAGIEYAHRYLGKSGRSVKESLVVYDLGGGTFDASVIDMQDRVHEVLSDEGIERLGGDDFDEILFDLVMSSGGGLGVESEHDRRRLLEECRQQKERLHPNTRKIMIDLSRVGEGGGEASVPVEEFYKRCRPLVEQTIGSLETVIRRTGREWGDVAALYLVGGSTDLPAVSRLLRDRYGRRVRRSPYPYAATAIGLAIAADGKAGYGLKERFTRYFGVWREAEEGNRIVFDPVFLKDTPLPGVADPSLVSSRGYIPAHNLGHFRYLECSHVTKEGRPSGDITPWDEILFPFDPDLQDDHRLETAGVLRSSRRSPQWIEEEYTCDGHGVIRVTITNQTEGYQRSYRLRGPSVPSQASRKTSG